MVSRTLGVVATAAMGASALLLPAGMNLENDPLFITGLDPKSQIIRMPCSSCVFSADAKKPVSALSDDETVYAQGGAIDVVFNVSISADNQLLINGDVADTWDGPKSVVQVPASATGSEIVNMETISETIEVTGFMATSSRDDVLTKHKYSITSLEGHSVQLDDLEVDILTLEDGELMIFDVRRAPAPVYDNILSDLAFNDAKKASKQQHDSPAPAPPSSDCANKGSFKKMFCEIKSHISQFKASHFRPSKKPGCKGGLFRPHHKPSMIIGEVPGHLKHRPHPHHGPHHQPRPSHDDPLATALFLIGVWTASFFVGYFSSWIILSLVALVRKVFFGVPLPSERKRMMEERELSEARALMGDDEEEALPVYEDAPVYEEVKEEKQ
jgi:hypothetical protein